MSHVTRIVAFVSILLGQVAVGAQAFAMADCHPTPGDGAALHASHGDGTHTAHENDEGDASPCHCLAGMHCGQVAVLFPADFGGASALFPASGYLAFAVPPTALAHRRDPDRPPSPRY